MKTRTLIIIGIVVILVASSSFIALTLQQTSQQCELLGGKIAGLFSCSDKYPTPGNEPKTAIDCRMIFGKGTTEMYDCLEKIKNNILTQKPSAIEPEPEYVLDIAQEFIKSSPTFLFDGIPDTLSLELVAIRESFPEQYVIEGDFDSLHGGYGDRTDVMVIQVITPHKINLVVISEQVTSAILDEKWDELNQLQLPWTTTKGPDETVSQENIPRFSLVYTKEGGIAGIRKVINIDSDENIITIEEMNEKVQSTIFEPEITELFKLIEDSEFFTIEQRDYPPQVGWADFFTYYLKITTESDEYQMNWTDASEIIPKSAQSIATQIESMANQKQCEDIDGLWGIWSNRSPATASCNPSTSDGGKECTDSSQCQSFCQANQGAEINSEEAGTCYGNELAICMQEVRYGVVEPEWCQ